MMRSIVATAHVKGDTNADYIDDLVWRNSVTGENSVWLMSAGNRSSVITLKTIADTNWQIAGTGDFNGNGTDDLVWRNASTGVNSVWLMSYGNLLNGAGLPLRTIADTNWQIVGTGDFNADGTTDLVWRNSVTGVNSVWLMKNGDLLNGSGLLLPDMADTNWKIVGP